MTTFTWIVGSTAALAALLLPAVAMAGGDLTRADFDRCNQQAMLAAGVSGAQPSASPSTSGASGSVSSGAPSTGATSGTGVSTSSPSGNTVSSPATGSASSPSGTISSGATTSGSGSVSSSASTSGAHDAQLDRAVQAYRACLQR